MDVFHNPVTLEGKHVRLEPLSLDHLDPLCRVALEDELWRLAPAPIQSREDLRAYIEAALSEQAAGRALPFAIIELAAADTIGSTRFGAIDPGNRRVEIGWTWIGRPWQRTAVNTEAKLLLLSHAFEAMNCIRVEFKTDALNHRSRQAILRIGATEEGTLRKHIVTASGRLRDSVYYSILDNEWPSIKKTLEQKLAPSGGPGR